jgi:hypothetical protein
MKLLKVEPATDGKHKLQALFLLDDGKTHLTKFGLKGSHSRIDGADDDTRRRYLARHKGDIENTSPLTRGNLSYYITWGESKDIRRNIEDFKRKFRV